MGCRGGRTSERKVQPSGYAPPPLGRKELPY
jgi:hypothetical protein